MIVPDVETGAVRLEITDPQGSGFAILLNQPGTVDLTLRLVGALARLRGYTKEGAGDA